MASKNKGLSRRDFLRQSSCFSSVAAMQSLGLASLLGASKSIASDDYKALVFIFLDGGNDAFNMLVPPGTGALRTAYEPGRRVGGLAANELHQCINQLAGYQALTFDDVMAILEELDVKVSLSIKSFRTWHLI